MKTEFPKTDGPKDMPVEKLVRHAIAGIEAGKSDIRPGPSKVLNIANRVAPNLVFSQMSRLHKRDLSPTSVGTARAGASFEMC